MVKIEIFTSPTCPHCPHAKKAVMNFAKDKDDIKVVETSTFTQDGQRRAKQFDVRSVPTLFVTSPQTPDRIAFVGVPSDNQLKKMIGLSLGKDEWPKQESIIDKIKNIWKGE